MLQVINTEEWYWSQILHAVNTKDVQSVIRMGIELKALGQVTKRIPVIQM